jgi:hypothetical protein
LGQPVKQQGLSVAVFMAYLAGRPHVSRLFRDCFTGNPFRIADAKVRVLQFQLGCQIQGMIIGRCAEKAFFEKGLDRRSNGRGEFVKHLHPPFAAAPNLA